MNEISVLSFNIWFDEYAECERTAALLACIYKNDPDVVCLQEVRPHIYEKLTKNLKQYGYHYPKHVTYNYGCVILSKYKISKCLTIPYKHTSMGRQLVIAKIDYPRQIYKNRQLYIENTDLMICTTHLESEFNRFSKNVTKWSQIDESFEVLEDIYDSYKNVIFCLDSNLTADEERLFNFPFNQENGWDDAWITKGNPDNKFTFDGKKNVYLKQRKSRYRTRLDRILYKSNNCKLEDFQIIKDASDNVFNWISPSDHFGILGKFEIK